tara:strand:- start:896 stop:1327 length:432 start_codon:yes stop_codon:yes gene_type:complete
MSTREQIKQSILKHEGKVNSVYKDHLGNATFGVGHLVLPTDDLQEGVEYSDEVVMEYFDKDFSIALEDAKKFVTEEHVHPTAFGIVVEMCFQLGLPKLQKFKRFHYHLNKCEYEASAAEMLDSRWAKQTPNRANALADKMKSI